MVHSVLFNEHSLHVFQLHRHPPPPTRPAANGVKVRGRGVMTSHVWWGGVVDFLPSCSWFSSTCRVTSPVLCVWFHLFIRITTLCFGISNHSNSRTIATSVPISGGPSGVFPQNDLGRGSRPCLFLIAAETLGFSPPSVTLLPRSVGASIILPVELGHHRLAKRLWSFTEKQFNSAKRGEPMEVQKTQNWFGKMLFTPFLK